MLEAEEPPTSQQHAHMLLPSEPAHSLQSAPLPPCPLPPPATPGKLVIKLGDKEVEWDPNFRLYMTSKQSNPHYGPEVSGKTMIINYGVTQQGLTEQLLNVTVKHER